MIVQGDEGTAYCSRCEEYARENEKLREERDHLRWGLEKLANPNWERRSTGKDAVDMAVYAQTILDAATTPEAK